eukprot:4489697-Amphidinium_carterae.1
MLEPETCSSMLSLSSGFECALMRRTSARHGYCKSPWDLHLVLLLWAAGKRNEQAFPSVRKRLGTLSWEA